MSMNITSLVSSQMAGISNASQVFGSSSANLASGDRLASAINGAAELAVANELNAGVAGVKQGMRNTQDGVSMLQVAEGGLGVVSDNIVRMQQLAIQAQSDVLSDQQKRVIDMEYQELALMNEQIVSGTEFNGVNVLDGDQTISITGDGKELLSLATKSANTGKLTLLDNLDDALTGLDSASEFVNAYRAELGAGMQSLERMSDSLSMQAENMLQAESDIRDIHAANLIAAETSKDILEMSLVAKQAHAKSVKQVANMFFG